MRNKKISMLSRFGFVIFGLLATTSTKANEAPELLAKALWFDAPVVDTDTELDRLNRAFVQLANSVRPAIVQVRVTRLENDKAPADTSRTQSRGSGFIINPEGYILTAQHVVDKSQEIEVRLADGERIQARIVAADVHADLAILKIAPPNPLPVVHWAIRTTTGLAT
jgi:S1-C subfamily serine protease